MFRACSLCLSPVLFLFWSTPVLADLNSANAAYNRGDYAAAVTEYRQMALAGDPIAQYNLGQAYKLGRGVPIDLNVALDWYRKAAEHTPPLAEAQDAYGLMLFQSGKRPEAMPYIQRSADHGDPRAQYVLGTAYFNGDIVGKDDIKAFAYMTLASASHNLPKASEALATMQAYIPLPEQEKGQALAREIQLNGQTQQIAALESKPTSPSGGQPTAIRTEALPASTAPGVAFGDTAPPLTSRPPTKPKPAWIAKTTPAATIMPPADAERPVEAPAIAEKPSGRYRIQLGAFGDQAKAQAYGEGILARNAAFTSLKFFLVKAGAVTRLQAGPLGSKAAAENLCASIKAHGGACLVVNP